MENISIICAVYLKDYQLQLTFSDGSTKVVDLKQYLELPIFQPLLNIDVFKNFTLNSFTIQWENGADFAPEFLFEIAK